MNPSVIYALVVTGIMLSFALRGIVQLLCALLRSRLVTVFVRKHLYAFLYRRRGCAPPVSRLNAILQGFYWIFTVGFNFLGVSSVPEGASRAGTLAIFNFVPLFLGSQTGLAADLIGLSIQTLSQLHRSIGVMAVVQTVGHIAAKCADGEFRIQSFQSSRTIYGLLAAGSIAALSLLSLPFPRNYFYETFLKLHYGLAILAMFSLWQHVGNSDVLNHVFLSSAGGVFAFVNLCRAIIMGYRNLTRQSRWTSASSIPLNGATTLTLQLPRPWKVQPGHIIRLWTPAAGLRSFFQIHPYCVAWWSEDEHGHATTVSLLIKTQRGFSRALAWSAPAGPFLAAVDGPYGQTVDTSKYGTIVLFATGIGIAAQLSVLKRAFEDYKLKENIVRRISIIWQLDSEKEQDWVKPWVDELLDADAEQKMLRISLYVPRDFVSSNVRLKHQVPYGSGTRINKLYGRVKLKEAIDIEMKERIGKLLITVSAETSFREKIRVLIQDKAELADYQELDFQPVQCRDFWSRREPEVDYEGVIKGQPTRRTFYGARWSRWGLTKGK